MFETQPSIWISGIRIDEPITVVTNLIVTAVCIYAYYRVKKNLEPSKFQRFIKYYFLTLGIGVAIGGIVGHGFLYALSFAWKLPGWLLCIISITLIERAIIEKSSALLTEKMQNFLIWSSHIKLILSMFLTAYFVNFAYVGYHTTLGLICIVASCSVFVFAKTKNSGSILYVIGVVVAALSGIIFMNKWGVDIWFNHLDVSHIFMAMSSYFFYQATIHVKAHDGIVIIED